LNRQIAKTISGLIVTSASAPKMVQLIIWNHTATAQRKSFSDNHLRAFSANPVAYNGVVGNKRRYQDVESVFSHMSALCCAETVAKVNATYVIRVTGAGSFYIDYSSGEGKVGTGEKIPGKPQGFEPDVHVTVSKDNCLKIFNREIQLATAYMTGKFELRGDVTKLMSIEGILKATRNVSKISKK